MKQYSIADKDINFSLSSSHISVTEGEEFTITLTASGSDAISGLEVPYRIGGVDGELPYGAWAFNQNPVILNGVVRYTGTKTNGENSYSSYANLNLTEAVIRSLNDIDMQQWQAVKDAVNELTGVTDWVWGVINKNVIFTPEPQGSMATIYDQHVYTCQLSGFFACTGGRKYRTMFAIGNDMAISDATSISSCSMTSNPTVGSCMTLKGRELTFFKVGNPDYDPNAELPEEYLTFNEIAQKIISNAESSNESTSLYAQIYLEEVAKSLFKTDPLKQFVKLSDISSDLEDNKILISNEEPILRRRVRVADYTYGLDSSLFVLDSNLKATKTFLARRDIHNETQEAFVLGLLLKPNVMVTVLIDNVYIPPTPPILPPPSLKPRIQVTALNKDIDEGAVAEFLITYENIRSNYKLKYEFIDSKDQFSSSGTLITTPEGSTIVRIPTEVLELNESDIRYIKLWIKDYPRISDIVYLKVLAGTTYNMRFLPGEYTIKLRPYSSYEITLIGAGGAGGGAVNNRGGNWDVDARGKPGGDTKVTLAGASVTAGGGEGGRDGHAHNGSSYYDGDSGLGGVVDILSIGSTFVIRSYIDGKPGAPRIRSDLHAGGEAVTDLGDVGYNGVGGIGAVGTRWTDNGGYNYGFGGGGGSGSFAICTVRNDTSRVQNLLLTVGGAGEIFDMAANNTWGNQASVGEGGFAIIKSL